MTPLLLLPGMMCDARLFAPQIDTLSATRQVVVGDITGADTVQELAANVLALAPERFALAGLSMGGIIAMEILRQAPERVERLALLDTNPCAERPEVQARRGPQMDKVRAGGLANVMRDELTPNYGIDGPRKAMIVDLCMEMALSLGAEVFLRQSRALRDRPDQQATLSGVTLPTLVLCGADDRLCPVDRHEVMHRLMPASRLIVVPGAGHLPTLHQPQAVGRALECWLADTPPA